MGEEWAYLQPRLAGLVEDGPAHSVRCVAPTVLKQKSAVGSAWPSFRSIQYHCHCGPPPVHQYIDIKSYQNLVVPPSCDSL